MKGSVRMIIAIVIVLPIILAASGTDFLENEKSAVHGSPDQAITLAAHKKPDTTKKPFGTRSPRHHTRTPTADPELLTLSPSLDSSELVMDNPTSNPTSETTVGEDVTTESPTLSPSEDSNAGEGEWVAPTKSPRHHTKIPSGVPTLKDSVGDSSVVPSAAPIFIPKFDKPTITKVINTTITEIIKDIEDISGHHVNSTEIDISAAVVLFTVLLTLFCCCCRCCSKRAVVKPTLPYIELPTSGRVDMESLTTRKDAQNYGSVRTSS